MMRPLIRLGIAISILFSNYIVTAQQQQPGCRDYYSRGLRPPTTVSISDTITVPDAFPVGDATVTVDVSHRRIGALVLSLSAADKTVVLKERGLGRLGDNMYMTTFSDNSNTPFPVEAEAAPFRGTFLPTQRLSFLYQDASPNKISAGSGGSLGDWTLRIDDVAPNNTIRPIALNGWILRLCPKSFTPLPSSPSPPIQQQPSPVPSPIQSSPRPIASPPPSVSGFQGPPQPKTPQSPSPSPPPTTTTTTTTTGGSPANQQPRPKNNNNNGNYGWKVVSSPSIDNQVHDIIYGLDGTVIGDDSSSSTNTGVVPPPFNLGLLSGFGIRNQLYGNNNNNNNNQQQQQGSSPPPKTTTTTTPTTTTTVPPINPTTTTTINNNNNNIIDNNNGGGNNIFTFIPNQMRNFNDRFDAYLQNKFGPYCSDQSCSNIKLKFWKAAIGIAYLKGIQSDKIHPGSLTEKLANLLPGNNPGLTKLSDAQKEWATKKKEILNNLSTWYDRLEQHMANHMDGLHALISSAIENGPNGLAALGIDPTVAMSALGPILGLDNPEDTKALLDGLQEAGFQDLMKEFLMPSSTTTAV